MVEDLSSGDFLPLLHQRFRLQLHRDEWIDLELASVTDLGHPAKPGLRSPFSIHFLGPLHAPALPQHIYRLEHGKMGTLDLFIVPLGPDAGRMRYEAIFT